VIGSVKRKLIHTPQNYITTYQTFNRGFIDLDRHYFYAYLQPKLSEYDAWFNVKDDYLIFGVSVKDPRNIKHYYSEFMEYMKKQYNAKITEQEKDERWLMPHIMPGCPIEYGYNRVLFAGETAGFLNPMGEGIYAGLESGYAAARAIEEMDWNDDLNLEALYSSYKANTAVLRDYMTRQWDFVGSMSETFGHMKIR
ncbi:FAD-binding dehydrogenase, partial [Lachnotalea glycerini]